MHQHVLSQITAMVAGHDVPAPLRVFRTQFVIHRGDGRRSLIMHRRAGSDGEESDAQHSCAPGRRFEQLVLKGGNAMTLAHRISPRASLDLDFSLEKDFEDLPDVQGRMERALADRFASVGFVPFDIKLIPRPSVQKDQSVLWWGGYQLDFKLIDEKRYRSFGSEKERLRRESFVVAPNQMKVFTVDFSKLGVSYPRAKSGTEQS